MLKYASGTKVDWDAILKVGFHYPSSRPEFTGRVDGPRTRVHFLTQTSAETSACLSEEGRSCIDVRRFFTSFKSLAITPVTSSRVEEPHDSVSSTVDCASDSDDNRIIDRQITTATKARLYDVDMLLRCSVTCSTDHISYSACWLKFHIMQQETYGW